MLYFHGFLILSALLAAAFVDPRTEAPLFVTLSILAGVAYLAALLELFRSAPRGRAGLLVCLGLAALPRLAFLAGPPALSDDVYRYVWDGRVQRLGHNPYVTVPADPALQALHTDVTRLMDHQDLPTIYPPVAQLFFRLVTTVDESVRAMKIAAVICDLLIVLLLARWLAGSGRSPWWVLAYAWNPLVTLEVAGSAHVDVLGVLWLVAAAVALQRGRTMLGAIAFSLAVGTKFLPAVLAPLLLGRVRLRDGLVGAGVLAAFYLPFAGHGLPAGSLGAYVDGWRFNGPLFALVAALLPERLAVGAAVAVGFAVASWLRPRPPAPIPPAAWAWPLAATLLFAPAVYPWYLLWLTPFLFAATVPAVWTVAILPTYLVWESVRTGGGWMLPAWIIWAEYGALVLAAATTIAFQRRRSSNPEA